MKRVLILTFLIVFPAEQAAKANSLPSFDDLVTYSTFAVGLVLKNSLSHYSKRIAINHGKSSIALRCASDAVGLFLLKEAGDVAVQSFANVAPDWLKPRKNNRLETENILLRQELKDLKSASIATDTIIQAERINELKINILSWLTSNMLQEVDRFIQSTSFFSASDHSVEIANLLMDYSKYVLELYPIQEQDTSNTTGESSTYNGTMISQKAEPFHLGSRVPQNTKLLLKNKLEKLMKKHDGIQAEFLLLLFDSLGIEINIELPESTAQSDTGTQSTDL